MPEMIDLGEGVHCVLRKHRGARHIRLAVHRDGRVILTLPFFVSYKRGRVFLESKVEWIREKVKNFAAQPQQLLYRGGAKEYTASRAQALQLIEERLEYFKHIYPAQWKRVSIRNQKTRWGSCSRAGNLSFNYRLLLLPPHLRDYIIVHELCHLVEMNHSQHFWALVARTFPDYKNLRKELRLL
jgi:predicted metal-dependent hydrolase